MKSQGFIFVWWGQGKELYQNTYQFDKIKLMDNQVVEFNKMRGSLEKRYFSSRLFTIISRLTVFFSILAFIFSTLLISVALFYALYAVIAIFLSFILIVGSMGLVFASESHILQDIWGVFDTFNGDAIRRVQLITTPIFLAIGAACLVFVIIYLSINAKIMRKGKTIALIVVCSIILLISLILLIAGGKS